MGWCELRARLRVLAAKFKRGRDPDTWEGADQDDVWSEMREKREKYRGK